MQKPVARKSIRAPRKPTAAKKVTGKAASRPASPAASPAPPRASKNILTAGIKALANVHEEAVARQSRVFESLLGLGRRADAEPVAASPPTTAAAATTHDPFGFRKFEDVFDQRVARAMQNLAVPSAQAFAALEAEVERLRAIVDRLEASARKR